MLHQPAPQTDAAANLQPRRAAVAAFIGTTIEWYDFYIYGLAAALVFGKVFFSKTLDPGIATLLSFVTLWAGFAARPIGGIIFGHLGDKIGRKTTLIITLILMGVATMGIGLLPGYAQIGMWAPVGLVVLRVIQGVAVGGEWGGAVLIASESAPKRKSILYSAFAQQGSPTGNLLATPLNLCSNSGAWTQVSVNTSTWAGVSVVLRFNVFDDGNAATTHALFDDIALG